VNNYTTLTSVVRLTEDVTRRLKRAAERNRQLEDLQLYYPEIWFPIWVKLLFERQEKERLISKEVLPRESSMFRV
jgi:hypothetical protein